MDSSGPCQLDIFDVYHRFCAIRYGNASGCMSSVHSHESESQQAKFCQDALAQLLKMIQSRLTMRSSLFDELHKLKSQLNITVNFSEFSHFYDFVFFICRENGQKNITVSRAVAAWRFALAGRFRLLDQWCDFVEMNHRYNISEDTWQQVLAFSRSVHETLEGYDPEGAWPVLIDDFVEHMYRILGSRNNTNFHCKCDDSETHDDSLPGLKNLPGLKRRLIDALKIEEENDPSNACHPESFLNSKRQCLWSHRSSPDLDKSIHDDCMEIVISPSKGPCSIERSLSKGFAGLFSTILI